MYGYGVDLPLLITSLKKIIKKRILIIRFINEGEDCMYDYGINLDCFGYDDLSLESDSNKSARYLK